MGISFHAMFKYKFIAPCSCCFQKFINIYKHMQPPLPHLIIINLMQEYISSFLHRFWTIIVCWCAITPSSCGQHVVLMHELPYDFHTIQCMPVSECADTEHRHALDCNFSLHSKQKPAHPLCVTSQYTWPPARCTVRSHT